MAKLKKIISFLNELVPENTQDSWDNSGLQVGNLEKEIKKVGFTLSVTKETLEEGAKEQVDLIIAHHPITVKGVTSLTPHHYPELLLYKAVELNISIYSMHTNLDVSPLGPTSLIAEYLQLEGTSSIQSLPPLYGAIGKLPVPLTQKELFLRLTSFLPKDVYRVINFKPESLVERVAICSGSCASFIEQVIGKAEVYVTGDVKYHDALKAIDCGLTVFDMGHFGTERLFYKKVEKALAKEFPELIFIHLFEKSPFEVVGYD